MTPLKRGSGSVQRQPALVLSLTFSRRGRCRQPCGTIAVRAASRPVVRPRIRLTSRCQRRQSRIMECPAPSIATHWCVHTALAGAEGLHRDEPGSVRRSAVPCKPAAGSWPAPDRHRFAATTAPARPRHRRRRSPKGCHHHRPSNGRPPRSSRNRTPRACRPAPLGVPQRVEAAAVPAAQLVLHQPDRHTVAEPAPQRSRRSAPSAHWPAATDGRHALRLTAGQHGTPPRNALSIFTSVTEPTASR